MEVVDTEYLLIILSSLVVLSYSFSIVSKNIKIPSVLLLLFAGIGFKILANFFHLGYTFPKSLVEGLGVVGLIMIILEAGLDLRLSRNKFNLVKYSFIAALVLLLLSVGCITMILVAWLQQPIMKCIIYAIPLSIMSSSIVIPSIHGLTENKKEFLVYESSFSDIVGIIFFNYFTSGEVFSLKAVGAFSLSIVGSVLLSVILSVALLVLLAKTKLNIKFFLIFSLLVVIYSGGKLLHLPSLIIILAFGLLINNWDQLPIHPLDKIVPDDEVNSLRAFLHSITAETSFLVRTFFFLLFGYSIDLNFLSNWSVILIGSLIVVILLVLRFFYLRFYFKARAIPEAFFIPRGLITIVLFYKIPAAYRLASFNEGVLFFVILSTSIILSLAMIFYKQENEKILAEPQFTEREDIL